jgi:hypothetical protein
MRIKSFHAGLASGITNAFKLLDKQIEEKLGDNIIIHSVKDDVYFQQEITSCNETSRGLPIAVRVVVYENKKPTRKK